MTNGAINSPSGSAPERQLQIPRHVAIIMDGNGRWAKRRGLGRRSGHEAGAENIRRVVRRLGEHGVEYLTLYAFSTENWGRPRAEVSWLMRMPSRWIRREIGAMHENGIRVRHLGRIDGLSRPLQREMRDAEALTAGNTRMTVSVAFNYGGRAELVDAVRRIAAAGIAPEKITEETIAAHLYAPDIPDPDLVIRTAGEMRFSNFLMWQSAYSEFFVSDLYWPDIDEAEIDRAVNSYGRRERRFGLTPGNGAES